MRRDLNQYIERYEEKFVRKNSSPTRGAFYAEDMIQLKKRIDKIALRGGSIDEMIYTAIDDALRAGFMVGYSCGRREVKR